MKKEGEYHFAMCRGEWYIWQVKEVYELVIVALKWTKKIVTEVHTMHM